VTLAGLLAIAVVTTYRRLRQSKEVNSRGFELLDVEGSSLATEMKDGSHG
jgi:hypothetical protein